MSTDSSEPASSNQGRVWLWVLLLVMLFCNFSEVKGVGWFFATVVYYSNGYPKLYTKLFYIDLHTDTGTHKVNIQTAHCSFKVQNCKQKWFDSQLMYKRTGLINSGEPFPHYTEWRGRGPCTCMAWKNWEHHLLLFACHSNILISESSGVSLLAFYQLCVTSAEKQVCKNTTLPRYI